MWVDSSMSRLFTFGERAPVPSGQKVWRALELVWVLWRAEHMSVPEMNPYSLFVKLLDQSEQGRIFSYIIFHM
jgi:hypothetical protein